MTNRVIIKIASQILRDKEENRLKNLSMIRNFRNSRNAIHHDFLHIKNCIIRVNLIWLLRNKTHALLNHMVSLTSVLALHGAILCDGEPL